MQGLTNMYKRILQSTHSDKNYAMMNVYSLVSVEGLTNVYMQIIQSKDPEENLYTCIPWIY